MSYQVIARKWRPQTFAEVTGQETITRTLRNAIEHERLHHAYLFSGARGVGKTTTARLLAKALNCHRANGPTPVPCRTTDEDACASCREVAEGRSIDVLEIDAASNTGVDNVRDAIIGSVAVHPARDRFKVFIIDEVHMLSGAAFNALLKTLEEPPPRVIFIMATTEQHKVPDTILSRCQQFEFRTIATPKITERLALIAAAEDVKIKDDALREIARAGEGSMRDAQSAFDQVISFSEGEITVADVETALGIASAESRARVMRAVAEQRPAEALAVVDDLVMRGHDLRNFCRDLLAHLRDLLVVKVAGAETEAADATEAERRELQRLGAEFSESDLVRFFHSLTETEKALRESAHPRYQLEIGLVKLIEMRRLAPLGQILERLAALEEALRTGGTPSVAPAGGSVPPATRGRGGNAPRGAAGGSTRTAAPPVSAYASAPANSEARAEASPAAPEAPGMQTVSAAAAASSSSTAQSAGAENFADAAAEEAADAAAALPPFSMEADADGFALAPPALKLVPPPASPENGETERRSSFMAQRGAEDQAGPGVPATAQDPTVEKIKDALDERRKPFLVSALEGARRVRVDENELYVEYAPESKHLRDTLAKPENVRVLREVCQEVLGRETGVRIAVKNAGAADEDDGPPAPPDQARQEQDQLRAMAENHPLVQQVLKTFRGEIIDVRRSEE